MNILICDDNERQVRQIEKCVSTYMNQAELNFNLFFLVSINDIEIIKYKFDIAFLDIELGFTTGIEVAKKLQKINKNIIIFFVTSYTQYLDDAMDLKIFRFLEKPINQDRLFSGLDKAIKIIDKTEVAVYLKADNSLIQIYTSDIVFIEIEERKTKIVTDQGTYYSNEGIEFWKKKLTHNNYYRVHKSYIINMNYITLYTRQEITLNKKYIVPVAYRKRTDFKKYFFGYIDNFCLS